MKTTVNALWAFLCVLMTINTLQAQSPAHADNYLVTVLPGTTQADINQALVELNSTEIWVSPVTNTRLWQVNYYPYVHTPDGDIVTNINEQKPKTKAKAFVDDFGFDYLTYKTPEPPYSANEDDNMNCAGALSAYTETDNESVHLGIFDTGCSYGPLGNFSDFYFDVYSTQAYDYVNDDPIADDRNGHGTHIVSTIAQTVNRYNGEMGEDGPNVHFDIRKSLNAIGEGNLSHIIMAFEEALLDGMDIANMSLSFQADPTLAYEHPFLLSLEAARDQFGVLVVCSAGNDSQDVDASQFPNYPASYSLDNILSVSTYDCNGDLASFANYGDISIDIAAAGIDIPGLPSMDTNGTDPDQLVYKSGTSQATAIVSGIAASLATQQVSFDYNLTRCAIMSSADYSNSLNEQLVSNGLLDADEARLWFENNCTPPGGNSLVNHGHNPITLGDNATLSDGELEIYPNPATTELNLELFSQQAQESIIEIRDLMGRLVFADSYSVDKGINNIILPTDDFSNGTYYLTYTLGKVSTMKSIVILK